MIREDGKSQFHSKHLRTQAKVEELGRHGVSHATARTTTYFPIIFV